MPFYELDISAYNMDGARGRCLDRKSKHGMQELCENEWTDAIRVELYLIPLSCRATLRWSQHACVAEETV